MLEHFWEIVGWACALNAAAFRVGSTLPQGEQLALGMVLLAGLSRGLGQCIMLFLNQVQPLRFVLSLVINAGLFVGGFLALVGCTWLVTLVPWSVSVPHAQLVTVLGLSYAPLLFSFLGALPYLGVPILSLLAGWHLLAMVVGFSAITRLGIAEAFGYVAFGWLVLQVIEETIGRPVAAIAQWLANAAAGVELKTAPRDLAMLLQDQIEDSTNELKTEIYQRLTLGQPAPNAEAMPPSQVSTAQDKTAQGGVLPGATIAPADTSVPWVAVPAHRGTARSDRRIWQTVLGLGALALFTILVLALLRPLREWWFGWFSHLPGFLRWGLNLLWMGAIALIVAGLLAPLETLGWWAGWYEDEVNTTVNTGDLDAIDEDEAIARYVVYLDGIGKSTFEYLPDVETFLAALAPQLPDGAALVRGIMPYSVLNKPLDEARTLSFFWKFADRLRLANPASVLGLIVNIRNILIVGVSADKRYGPLYNQGIAQIVFSGLVKNGYQVGSGTPVTFIGYSGGGQMACACAPFLKRAIAAPIDVISLGGVISANSNLLQLEHLHHLVGEKDTVERLGPIFFPGRWRLFALSYWNRAKRLGKITHISLGAVGHNVPGGLLDPDLTLPDGRSALQQTIDTINAILQDELTPDAPIEAAKPSNYDFYRQVPWCQPSFYPLDQTVDPALFQPIGAWQGRLILPPKEARSQVRGALLEVHHAPAEYHFLVGQTVPLRWQLEHPTVRQLVKAVTRDVHFSADAEYHTRFGGMVLAERINHWRRVDPLESLAAGHPVDDITVMLDSVTVRPQSNGDPALYIREQPIEITGRYYALVQFIAPIAPDQYQVRHFNPATRRFDGPEAVMGTPPVVLAKDYGSYPSTLHQVENSPCNEQGWYVYGANNAAGQFVVQAWMPRGLMRLQPDRVLFGSQATYRHLRQHTWANIAAQKGHISSILGTPVNDGTPAAIQTAVADWQAGDRALVLHTYGGIGGANREPAAASPIFFGHFAFGVAEVIRDPLAEELRFDLRYYQVYTQNTDGLVAGTLHWSRYLGDRQRGWLGNRPTCDILLKLPCFTDDYDFQGDQRSPLRRMEAFLMAMTARYRIGDGTGATYVGPANNCAQDSNQALFAAIQQVGHVIGDHPAQLAAWAAQNPAQAARFQALMAFGKELKRTLQPFGKPRPDWETNEFNLGSTLEDKPLDNLIMGLSSWRTLLPRKASDTIARKFLHHHAAAWILRTNQVGGHDPDIAPIAPITL